MEVTDMTLRTAVVVLVLAVVLVDILVMEDQKHQVVVEQMEPEALVAADLVVVAV